MEKVIDNRKYVIDVSVDEVSSAIESETTFSPEGSVQSCNQQETLLRLVMLQLVAALVYQFQVLTLRLKLLKPVLLPFQSPK